MYTYIRNNTCVIVCIDRYYMILTYYILFAQVEWFRFSDSLDCWVVFHRDMSWSWHHPYQDSASFSHKTIARRRSLAHPCRVTLWSLLVPPSADCCEVYKLLSGHENVMTERLNPTYSRRLSLRESNPSLSPSTQDVFCHVSDLQDGEGSVVEAAETRFFSWSIPMTWHLVKFEVKQFAIGIRISYLGSFVRATTCCTRRNGTIARLASNSFQKASWRFWYSDTFSTFGTSQLFRCTVKLL